MSETADTIRETVSAILAAKGVEYSAAFVPFSKSRNKNSDHKTLNWRVTFKRGRAEMSTDFSQGIGHLPPSIRNMRDKYAQRKAEEVAAESGRVPKCGFGGDAHYYVTGSCPKLTPPTAADVLYCLLSDAAVLDHPNFESWASEYGYDVDSRKAEQTYKACLSIALEMRAVFTEEDSRALREIVQDL